MKCSIKKVAAPVITVLLLVNTLFSVVSIVHASEDETTYYFLTDHLGSVDVVMDEEGNVVERRDYKPYGAERLHIEESDEQDEAYGFTGKEIDDETGLHYYGARYYDSEIGRFISIDPLVLDEAIKTNANLRSVLRNPQKLNAYTYVLNNPLLFIDPFGESEFTEKWRRVGAYADSFVLITTGFQLSILAQANTAQAAFGVVTSGNGAFKLGKTVLEEIGSEELEQAGQPEIEYPPIVENTATIVNTAASAAYNPDSIFGQVVETASSGPGYEEGFEAIAEMVENNVTASEFLDSVKVAIPELVADMVNGYNETINSSWINSYNFVKEISIEIIDKFQEDDNEE